MVTLEMEFCWAFVIAVSEHLCKDGWQPGKVKDCGICKTRDFKIGQYIQVKSGSKDAG